MRRPLRTVSLGLLAGASVPLFVLAADPPRIRTPGPAEQMLQDEVPLARSGSDDAATAYVPVRMKFQTAAECSRTMAELKPPFHRFLQEREFADVLVEIVPGENVNSVIKAFAEKQKLEAWETARPVVVPPPKDGVVSQLAPMASEPIVHGGRPGLTGKGVAVAIIDTGVDFRHPDFRRPDGSSRIKHYWDTQQPYKEGRGRKGPVEFPNKSPIGTYYTGDDLTEILKADDKTSGPIDPDGHGTCCAGVAAGNGAARAKAEADDPRLKDYDYRGVAPDADLIVVSIANSDKKLSGAWLFGRIIRWLDETAGKAPLVVSCSFGSLNGHYDGMKVNEQQLGRLLAPSRPGRVVCIAAGNEGDDDRHVSLTVVKGKPQSLSWRSPDPLLQPKHVLRLHTENADIDALKLEKLNPKVSAKFDPPESRKFYDENGATIGKVCNQRIVCSGDGGIRIETESATPLRVDAYLFADSDENGRLLGRLAGAVNRNQVAEPAAADAAISVGSYNFNAIMLKKDGAESRDSVSGETIEPGKISGYSNAGFVRPFDRYDPVLERGPRRGVKPEVVAPGQWHVAAACELTPSSRLDASGKYKRFNGTSAATPYTAGVVALLMEKNGDLTADEFRALLKSCASKPDGIRELPHPLWGFGKLDIAAVDELIRQTKAKSR